MADCLWEICKVEGELQGDSWLPATSPHWGCATSPQGLSRWHGTCRTWGTEQGTRTAPASTTGDLPSRSEPEAPQVHHLDHAISLTALGISQSALVGRVL